jgi:hypothetical protein
MVESWPRFSDHCHAGLAPDLSPPDPPPKSMCAFSLDSQTALPCGFATCQKQHRPDLRLPFGFLPAANGAGMEHRLHPFQAHFWVKSPATRALVESYPWLAALAGADFPNIDWRLKHLIIRINAARNDLEMSYYLSHDGYPNWEAFVTLEHGPANDLQVAHSRIYEYDHNGPPRRTISALEGDGTAIESHAVVPLQIFRVIQT